MITDGIEMIIVVTWKKPLITGPMPVRNMWCALCAPGADVRHGRRELRSFPIRVPRAQCCDVRVTGRRVFGETFSNPTFDGCDVTREHPLDEPKRPEVLAAARVALAQTERGDRVERELGDIDFDELIAIENTARARIGLVTRLAKAAARKAVNVQNDERTIGDERQIHLQGRGVEGH
jgi:hypothetical protein